MNRRFHVPSLFPGRITLDAAQSRHLRDVLRIQEGDSVSLFDNAGHLARALVVRLADLVEMQVAAVADAPKIAAPLTIAAATPKGARADWMVEKLSELGVACLIPLNSARTVVHPEAGKLQRWQRIAAESAKQCKRPAVMEILAPQGLSQIAADARYARHTRWLLSTTCDSAPASAATAALADQPILALIGPEGGWTDSEESLLRTSGFAPLQLTRTILRIETAAVVLASLVMVQIAGPVSKE